MIQHPTVQVFHRPGWVRHKQRAMSGLENTCRNSNARRSSNFMNAVAQPILQVANRNQKTNDKCVLPHLTLTKTTTAMTTTADQRLTTKMPQCPKKNYCMSKVSFKTLTFDLFILSQPYYTRVAAQGEVDKKRGIAKIGSRPASGNQKQPVSRTYTTQPICSK